MRLYLSSFDVGNCPDELVALAGSARRAAIVVNALDHRPQARTGWLERQTSKLVDLGFSVVELDLRNYFGSTAPLQRALRDVDLVWINGGNAFILRRAMKQSGFDVIIRDAVARDEIVYAGFSAAAVIAYKSLEGLELTDNPHEVPAGYDPETVWDGLGFVPFAIAVHFKSDHPESASVDREIAFYEESGIPYRTLRDGEAMVIHGQHEKVVGSERPARDSANITPEDRVATYRKQLQDWPYRVIRRGDAVRPLPPHARSLSELTYDMGDTRLSVSDYMARRDTSGLLILKGGEIALERYGMGRSPETPWTSFSTAKSMTSTLCGAALHDGAIGSLDERCDLYLPQLSGSAYEGVTIRNVMRMCSGVAWSEEDDGRASAGGLSRALASRRPGAILDLLCRLPRAQPQGAVFNYSTVESCLLGALVAAATGRSLADYCAETIWGPAGMEANGSWLLESADGLEMGGFGVSARLRDLGRFGQLVLEDGEAFTGRRVLPPGWRDLAGQPDSAATGFGRLMPASPWGYGYQWWALPHGPTGIHAGAFLAIGSFGQYIYVHPATQVVAVIQSAWRQHEDLEATLETFALLRAALLALRAD